MVSNILKGVVSFILVIFFISPISANFTIGNPSHLIEESYGPGDTITGWVNISLKNEPTGSILKSSLEGSISLIDLLKKASNSGFVKSCSTINCVSGYLASNEATSKTLNLNENQSVLIGFNISGSARDLLTIVSSFAFNLTSNNPETEKFPLAVDILNDGQNEWMPYVASDNFGGENKGCFEIATGQANIAYVSYCERIKLQRTPEVEIGTYVQGNEAGVGFYMKIESTDGMESGSCTADTVGGAGIERISCIVPSFSVNKNTDYFVCVKTILPSDADKYKISIEQNNPCGFSSASGNYEGGYNYDFDIFARPKKYIGRINFTLNDDELINARSSVTDIEEYLRDYISTVYNDNCSKGCVIPVKIFAGVAQQIILSGASISYIAGISTTTDKFYDIAETPALINSGFQKLYLGEAGFRAPMDYGSKTFSVSLNDQILFSEEINVGEVPTIKSLTPTKTGVKYPTKFTVILNDSRNITKYMWNFGDGQMQNTTKGEVTHTYNAVGSYKLKITLLESTGKSSSKEFSITVAPASEVVPDLLVAAEINIAQIKSQIQTLSSFEQKAINYSLKLSQLESSITRLKTSASQASSETQFETILGELLGMKIPQTVTKTAYSEGISFYPIGNNINLNILKKIGGGAYEAKKEERYKEAVLIWDEENINTILVYNEISAIYPDYEEPFLRTFDITITNRGESAYIIIKDMGNILFKEDYFQKKEGEYYYIIFDKPEERIVFSTTESVDFINLPMFISPGISQLTLREWTPFTKGGELKKWILFSIVMILILLAALAVWIILQFWYKRKYENYLFKNRNNLYNLINYIQNEKSKGTGEKDMIVKLKKSGWTSEQIRYVMRKYAGKRTGMPEIPIQKILKEKKSK